MNILTPESGTMDPKYLSEDYEPSVEELRAEAELASWCERMDETEKQRLRAICDKSMMLRALTPVGMTTGMFGAAALGSLTSAAENMLRRFGATRHCGLTKRQERIVNELREKLK